MSAIIAAFVDHPRVIIAVMCLALIALVEVAVYRAGGNAVATRMHTERVMAQLKTDSALAEAKAALVRVQDQNEVLHAVSVSLRVKADSLSRTVAEAHTSANLVNSRLVIRGDTARVSTDSGVVEIPISEVLTRQLAQMQFVNDSLVHAMDRRHEADSSLVSGLTQENSGLRTQIGIDSVIKLQYRKQLAAVEQRAEAAEAKPKHSAAVAFLGGVVTTLIGGIVVAVVF